MNGTSTRERLAKKHNDKASQHQNKHPPDTLHNLQTPCCRVLQEATLDIFPETAAPKEYEPSILGKLARKRLQQQSAGTTTISNVSTMNHKKKKRRKKKKKTEETAEEAKAEGPAFTQDRIEKSDSKQDQGESQQQQQQQQQHLQPEEQSHTPQEQPLHPPCSFTMSDILQQYPPMEDDLPRNRQLHSFLRHISLQTQRPIQLNLLQVQAAVDAISCDACKQVAQSYFWRMFATEESFSLAPSLLTLPKEQTSPLAIPGGGMEDSVERAFDYVAMEEGYAESDDAVLVFDRPADLESSVTTTTATVQALECNDTLTMEKLEIIIKDMILPNGLAEAQETREDDTSADNAFPGNVHFIVEDVKARETDIRDSFQHFERNQSTAMAQIEESLHMATSTFDVKTSAAFRDIDKALDMDFSSMICMVRDISFQHYNSSKRKQHELVLGVEELYSCIAGAVLTIQDAQLAHAAKLLQLANRPGSVPQMALCAQHRDSYRSLLAVKVGALQKLRRQLESRMMDRLLCRNIWTRVLVDKALSPRDSTTTEDDGMVDVWSSCERTTHTIHCGNVKDLKNGQVERANEWMKCIKRAQESLTRNQSYSMLEEYQILLANANSLNSIVDCNGDEAAREEAIPQFINAVFLVFQNVLNQWLYLKRVTEVTEDLGTTNVDLPLKLKRFLRGQGEPHVWSDGTCQGGGGRRRVTAIMTGLLYRWLQDRCNEWHAELTQKELLESMVDEPIADAKSTEPKARAKGKKSKKKKDKKSVLGVNTASSPPAKQMDTASDVADKNPKAKDVLDTPSDAAGKSTENLDASSDSNIVGRGTNVADVSNENCTRDLSAPKPANGKEKKEKKSPQTRILSPAVVESFEERNAAKAVVDEGNEVADTAKENNDRGRPSAKLGNSEEKKKKEKKSKSPQPKTLSPASQSSPAKTKNRMNVSKDKGAWTSVGSKKTTKTSPRKQSTPSTPAVDIGVVSPTEFQSAESFLIQRLMAVLRAEGKKESNS